MIGLAVSEWGVCAPSAILRGSLSFPRALVPPVPILGICLFLLSSRPFSRLEPNVSGPMQPFD